MIDRKRLAQHFWIMILISYDLLKIDRLDLDFDNPFRYEEYLTLLQTTLTFDFSHTKHKVTKENRTC